MGRILPEILYFAPSAATAKRALSVVFIESTINPRTVQAVIDAAAEPDTAGGTYIGMLVENTLTIAEALGGELAQLPAPLLGWATRWNIEIAEN